MEKLQIYNAEFDNDQFVNYARDQHIWINDNRHLDLCMGGGTHIFGHSPEFIIDAMEYAIALGTLYSFPAQIASRYAKRFSQLTGYKDLVFCNTGTEANMRAFRIARAYTGRTKIAILQNSWHGSNDSTLWLDRGLGVPKPQDVVVLDRNTDLSTLAMVFVEPHQGSCPEVNNEFLKDLRYECNKHGVLLGFDEVLTGIRVGRRYCKVKPDISTYGKVCGGGYPIGLVAGKRKIMKVINKGVFMGGTFSGNPVSLTAGLAVLNKVNDRVLNKLDKLSSRLMIGVNKTCTKVKIVGVGNILKLVFSGLDSKQFIKTLREYNILVSGNRLIALSTVHTDTDIDCAIKAIKNVELECLSN